MTFKTKQPEPPKFDAPRWLLTLLACALLLLGGAVNGYVGHRANVDTEARLREMDRLVRQMPDVIRVPKRCVCGGGCSCCPCQEAMP